MANFNTEPFFDDYSEDNKFYRILFRPGYAVQARELTQMQTILQEQVRRHGDHIFKEGTMVIPGQVSYDLNVSYVKIVTDPAIDVEQVLLALVGKEIKNSSGLKAKVISYAKAETVAGVLEENTLFLKYQNSIQDNVGNNIQVFQVNDSLTPVDLTAGLDVVVADTYRPTGFGCSATVQRGIYYINKHFVLVQDQSVILDKYTSTPTYRVGLRMTESTIYPEDDESLLDNALGSPNYAAPGSARYSIDLVLTKIAENPDLVTTAEEKDFIDLLRLKEGKVIFKLDKTAYSEIEKTLARRTYDESGDYTVTPFRIQPREYRNNFRGGWSKGEKYIQGDLIKVSDGSPLGSNYFVATTNGISNDTAMPTDFLNWQIVDFINDNSVKWEYSLYPAFNQGVHTFTSGDADFKSFELNDHLILDGMLAMGVEAGKAYVRGYEIEKISTEYIPVPKSRDFAAGSAALATYFGLPSIPASTAALTQTKTATIDMSLGSYVLASKLKYLPDISTLASVNLHSVADATSAATAIGTAKIRAVENHNSTTVAAGSLAIGETYTIEVVGSTDFTLLGAASNTVGVSFTSTGVGSGTGSARSYTYKVFLFDILMNSGKKFVDAKSVYTVATSFKCNFIQTDGSTVIQNPDATSLIYPLPDYAIANILGASYTVVAPFSGTAAAGKIDVVPPTGGYSFESVYDTDNYIVLNQTTGTIVQPTLEVLSNGTLRVSSLVNGNNYVVHAAIRRTSSTVQTRRSTTDAAAMQLKTAVEAQPKVITLANSFVTRIVSVMMSASAWGTANPVYSENITNRYSFNYKQTSSAIDQSTLELISGADVPTGPISIKYEYLDSAEISPGDFIGVNSYTHANSKLRYDQIPATESYALRDCVDFRPYMVNNAYKNRYFPKFGSTAAITYTNYLARIDTISLSVDGKYLVSNGIPSENPYEPSTPNLSMKLARVSIEPYTFHRGDQIGAAISPIENKRYTMRDIGTLERRIQDLEYYTALSLTELDTKNMRIVDADGLERYQNGFLVDAFDGQGIGNVSSDDWNCSIDMTKKELRPFFSQKQVNLLENRGAATSNYKVSGDLVTLPYSEVSMITQNKASKTESVNPYAVYSWKGIVSINPWSDTWFSTHHRPDIIINDENQYNAVVAKAESDGVLGTIWNSWQTVFSSTRSLGTRLENLGAWSVADTKIMNATNNGGSFWRNRATFTTAELDFIGNTNHNVGSTQADSVAGSRVLTIETQAVETQAARSGVRSFITDRVDSRVIEDRVVETQVVPYIRPRAVLFLGYGFRPATKLYAFFDNVLVNDYIRPATRLLISRKMKNGSTYYPHTFDVERNCGSNVSTVERTALYLNGNDITGAITVTNGSSIVTGVATQFLQDVAVGDKIDLSGVHYIVQSVTDNYTLTLTTVYAGVTAAGISCVLEPGSGRNTEEVEVAFNHGEVIRERNGNGNTAIVVGQEISGSNYYIHVVNIKGSGTFSTAPDAYLEGEYTGAGEVPIVKFVEKTSYSNLISSETGLVCGIFDIPSNPAMKFRTGTREIIFSDSASNLPGARADQESTSGGAIYEAKGVVEVMQRTIVATRTANIVAEQVSDANTIVSTTQRLTRDTGWFDPLAQTFLVQQEGGAFITSVEVFFAQRDEKIPVRVEIREVVNGYPGSTVLPFSRVEKKASGVLVSADSKTPTVFKFSSPVFLQNGTEYALVVLSDSSTYRLWVSETTGIDVATQVIISSQPYSGVLFKSQNASAWTADQTQDMKFRINRAEFESSPVSIELIPPKLGFKNLGFNPLNFIAGSRKCRVEHSSHGMIAGEKVLLKCRQVVDSINGIVATNIFNVEHTILSAELDSYVIEIPGTINSSVSGKVGGGYITASENYEFETALIEISEVVPPGTSISYSADVVNHAGEIMSYKMIPKENLAFNEVKVFPSSYNYNSVNMPSGLRIVATLNPATANTAISPIIDLGRLAMTMVSSKIDNPDLSINDSTLDYFPISPVVDGTLTGVEIGTGKAIDLIDVNGDSSLDTIVIDSLTNMILYTNFNNNISTGDVLRFNYSGVTSGIRNMIITEKYIIDSKLYFVLKGFNDESLMMTTTGNAATIVWLSHFKSEYASIGGSTHSKYVTKKINFSRPSEMLKIMFSAIIPDDAEVEIYYKTGVGVAGDFIASAYSRAMPKSYTKSTTEFTEIVADIEGLPSFDSVMIKLVMKSINKAMTPRISDFRVIACAA